MPGDWRPPLDLDEDAAGAMFAAYPLGRLQPIVQGALQAVSTAAEHLVVVSDADGLLLSVDGDSRVRREAAEELHFVPGARFSERSAGTNAIGTSLAADHPVHVFASEHFGDHSRWWTCVAAPVRDPKTGDVLGSVGLTGRMETAHPHSLALVVAVASMLEAALRVGPPGAAAAPLLLPVRSGSRPRLTIAALDRDRAEVGVDGEMHALSLRHSEILVLLAANPSGMTGDQLAIALYGDAGKPVSARAEMSRLRRILRSCLKTDPYRLDADVAADFALVQQRLRSGSARAAAGRYPGPLLPRSDAPGVVVLRHELDGWIRRAVMSSDDVEALWTWLGTPSGAEDLHAWKRFLANLPHEDGRRGLAAARLERLRPLLDAAA